MNLATANKMKKILSISVWVLIGVGLVVLLLAAVRKNNIRRCVGIKIAIEGSNKKLFIDESEIRNLIIKQVKGSVKGMPINSFDLHAIEKALKKDIWLGEVKLYFDNNDMFRVHVTERDPVARVFSLSGNSFYIDSSLMMLPLSDYFSARLPVFTGFPSDKGMMKKEDSALLREVCLLSREIQSDSVISALIDQVDINALREFELVPKIGKHIILFGNADDAAEKFARLKLFYKKKLPNTGIGRYSRLSLKFKGQIVATLKGVEDRYTDSVNALALLKAIAEKSERLASDSSIQWKTENDRNNNDALMIQQAAEREEGPSDGNGGGVSVPVKTIIPADLSSGKTNMASPQPKNKNAVVVKKTGLKNNNKPVAKVVVSKSTVAKKQPTGNSKASKTGKALMPDNKSKTSKNKK